MNFKNIFTSFAIAFMLQTENLSQFGGEDTFGSIQPSARKISSVEYEPFPTLYKVQSIGYGYQLGQTKLLAFAFIPQFVVSAKGLQKISGYSMQLQYYFTNERYGSFAAVQSSISKVELNNSTHTNASEKALKFSILLGYKFFPVEELRIYLSFSAGENIHVWSSPKRNEATNKIFNPATSMVIGYEFN